MKFQRQEQQGIAGEWSRKSVLVQAQLIYLAFRLQNKSFEADLLTLNCAKLTLG